MLNKKKKTRTEITLKFMEKRWKHKNFFWNVIFWIVNCNCVSASVVRFATLFYVSWVRFVWLLICNLMGKASKTVNVRMMLFSISLRLSNSNSLILYSVFTCFLFLLKASSNNNNNESAYKNKFGQIFFSFPFYYHKLNSILFCEEKLEKKKIVSSLHIFQLIY